MLAGDACSWAVAIVQHNGSAPASDYCFTAPERLLAPSMSANASVLTMPRSAVAMLLERAVVRFRGAEPECCWAWKAVAPASVRRWPRSGIQKRPSRALLPTRRSGHARG
jgi:hypothetical protein